MIIYINSVELGDNSLCSFKKITKNKCVTHSDNVGQKSFL